MSEVTIPVVYELTVGGFGGYLVGFALKKVTKGLAFIFAVIVLAVIYLAFSGILDINYVGFATDIKDSLNYAGQAFVGIAPFLTNLPLIGSFILGLFVAYKMA
ncbi:MAG TPA: FUN14 domain-containing protein [Candidatus Bathyarchaeia archaeon]|nr:FUN14 domain-containing protein [Candidatus Bathyarchaeia archaeon]